MRRFRRARWLLAPIALAIAVALWVQVRLSYGGLAEAVVFRSGDVDLQGVLVRPPGPGPHPAVVLLHGSGTRQTHDKWAFRIHSNLFVSRGFAVLTYTKRGSGKSDIDYREVTFDDLVDDAVRAVEFLRERPGIDGARIGLRVVSESGWLAPEIALRAGGLAFVIFKSGPSLPWIDTVAHEVRMESLAAGLDERDVDDVVVPLYRRYWRLIADAAGDSSILEEPERAAFDADLAAAREDARLASVLPRGLPDYDRERYAARASKIAYDPRPFLRQLDLPMLWLFGSEDAAIPTAASVESLDELVRNGDRPLTIRIFRGASHYLYRWDRLPIEFYGFYVPGYLEIQGDWAAEQVAARSPGPP